VFDQADVRAQVGLQFDLYAYDLDARRTVRLTTGARAADPDLLADGSIVCTVQRIDRRDLVTYPFDAGTLTIGAPEVLLSGAGVAFTAPRVSPDGRWIAVERRRPGRMPEVVIVDRDTREVRVVAAAADRRFTTPAWSPDGRTLLMAADLGDERFGLIAADVESGQLRQLEETGAAARSPLVTADGRTVLYVGTTEAGDDLFALPLADAHWTSVPRSHEGEAPVAAAPSVVDGSIYSPWRLLAPRFWTPTVESDAGETVVGAATAAADPLGYHAFVVGARWAAARARPDWQVGYAYDRWWPTIFMNYSDDTDPLDAGRTTRTREGTVGALLPMRAVRHTQSVLAAAYYGDERLERPDAAAPAPEARRRRGAVRFGYSWNSSRLYGYSISREDGSSATLSSELTREALGGDGNASALIADVRHYQAAWPRHGVVAVRAAAAGSWGDDRVRRRFAASGDNGQSGGFRFGVDAIDLVRGFETGPARTRAAVVNVDYRVPLWRIQRGVGAWPFFARTLHAAVFVDVGHTWDVEPRLADARRSAGAELSLDTVLGHVLPLTVAAGAAWRHDGGRGSEAAVFARVGRAF
jgi:WD40-like Beta Propeller Repeat